MEIKTKVFKRKSGKSKGKWIARITYFDEIHGRTRTIERQADRKTDANDERDEQVAKLKKTRGQSRHGEKMTFNQLVDVCKEAFYKDAVIVEGRKVAGVRSIGSTKIYLDTLTKFFGEWPINNITSESLNDYRLWRIKTGSRNPNLVKKREVQPVKIATLNRELGVMRRMMRHALAKGWLLKDVFYGAGVIDKSAELERSRILTRGEEAALLDSCQGERTVEYERTLRGKKMTVKATISADNPHLKAMIILAVDSAMRLGEILKLRWDDIDFDNHMIRVVGSHTKTERERLAPLSDRAKIELLNLRPISPSQPFPFSDIKRSFNTAKRLAGISDLHFHDLRRTALTRWQQAGVPLALAGKFAGHTQLQTTMRHYTATDLAAVKELNEILNNSQVETPEIVTGMVS